MNGNRTKVYFFFNFLTEKVIIVSSHFLKRDASSLSTFYIHCTQGLTSEEGSEKPILGNN